MPTELLQRNTVSLEMLRQRAVAGHLYAVLDACDAPSVPPKVEELGEQRVVSLYRGLPEEEYAAFAPYLAQVDNELLDWIVEELWPEPWGIFIVAEVALNALRTHLRHFLIVDDPQGEEMYFRFYDPRVLRKYLPTCNPNELAKFYGPIQAYLTHQPDLVASVQSLSRAPYAGPLSAPALMRVGQRFPIREAQMAVFAPEAEAAFETRLIEHLREHHSDLVEDFPDDILLEMSRTGIARARKYGMTWESNLTAYVALMFEIAPNFDRHPRMQMVLSSRQIPPDDKLDVLIERIPETIWQELKRGNNTPAHPQTNKATT